MRIILLLGESQSCRKGIIGDFKIQGINQICLYFFFVVANFLSEVA